MLIPWTPRRSWYLHNPDTWKDLEISLTVEGHRDVKISGIFECWRFWHSWEDRILKKSSQLNSLKLVVSRYFFYIPKFQIFRFFKLSLAFEIYCQLKRVQSYMDITSLVWKKSVLNLTSFGSVAFFFFHIHCSRYRLLRVWGRILCILRARNPLYQVSRVPEWYRARNSHC